jgi:hypothetical protein
MDSINRRISMKMMVGCVLVCLPRQTMLTVAAARRSQEL